MRGLLAAALLLPALLVPTGAAAGPEEEIAHLLHTIEKSDCVFTRNGKEHTGVEAMEHIRTKYDYVKRKVKRAEDFIEYAATKSSMTGRPYLVRCGEEEMATADWLKAELAAFRKSREETIIRNERSTP
jgi:hypothetical protein